MEAAKPGIRPRSFERYFIQVKHERKWRGKESTFHWADAHLDCNMRGTADLQWAKDYLPRAEDHQGKECRVIKRIFTITAEVVQSSPKVLKSRRKKIGSKRRV